MHQAEKKLSEYCKNANAYNEIRKNNEKHLETVDEFVTHYTSATAIDWYTRESFVYRLLNKTLRHNNVDILLDFGFYIIDINKRLRTLCMEQKDENEIGLHVYRGQFIDPSELIRMQLNVGCFISINTFFSTSLNRNHAIACSGSGCQRPFFESVLFDIYIDKENAGSGLFAKIAKFSARDIEEEVLIALGTFFRLEAVFQSETSDLWIIELVMCDPNDKKLHDHFDVILLHLVDILCHLSPRTNTMNKMMLNRCRQYSAGNEVELQKLDDFEANYLSDKCCSLVYKRFYTLSITESCSSI